MDGRPRPGAVKKRDVRVAIIEHESQSSSSSFPLLRTSSTCTPWPASGGSSTERPRTQSASTSGTRASVKSSPPRRKTGAQVNGANKKRKTTPPQDKAAGSNAGSTSVDAMRPGRPALARQVSTSSNCRRKFVGDAECGEGSPTEEDEAKKRLTLVFGIVAATLFLLAVLMVAIGLRMSSPSGPSHSVRKENEQQTSVASSSSGVELAMFNVTTPATPSAALPNATTSTLSSLSAAMFNVTKPSGAT